MFSFRRAEADPQSASAIPDHVIERPRRGSVMSLSQTLYSLDSTPPPPADLEQIHASSSQAPGLTSFSLASPPSGSTEQLSFNNLYSRVKRVASAVRDVVSVPVRDGASRMSLGSIGSDRYQGHADSRDSFMSSATIDSEDSNYPVLPTSPLSPIKSQFGKHSRITSSSSLQSSSRVSSNNSMASTAMAGDYAPPAALRKVNLRASNSGAPVPSLAPITVFRDGDGSEFVSLTSPGLGVKGMSDVSRKDNEANLQNSAKEKAAGVQRTTVNALLGAAGTVVGGTVGYPPLPVSKTVEDESGARAENDEESNSSASEEDGGAISDSSDDDIILLNSRLPGGHEGDKIGTYGSKAIKVAGSSSESQPVSVQRSSSKDIPAPLNINNSNHLPPSTTGSDVASGTSLESNAASFVNNRLQSPGTSPSAIKSAINLPPKGDKNSPSSNQQTNVPGKPSLPPPNSPMAGSGETARKQRPTVSKISTDQASLLPGFSVTREASSESGSSQDATSTADVGKHSGGSSMYQYREGFQDGMVNGGNTGPNGGVGTGNSEAVSQALRQLRMGNLTSDFWMKDELCKECFLCANTFGVFRRKHHCRLCGQIFCSKCTTLISGDRFQHQGSMRVCSPCLEIVNEYQDESESEDDFSPASVFHIHQPIDQRHEMQSGPGSVVGTPIGGPMTPGFSMPRESRPATTPLMAIPASRITAGSNPNRRSQILEINAEIPSPPRPPSSRSGKSPMSFSRPLTANALKLPQHGHSHSHSHHHHHKHQHSRSHRWFPAANANERAPFHRNVADELGLQGALPAFHSDSIIDPDLAPYMSDDASDDEQMSIFATIAPKYGEAFGNLFSTSAAGSQSGQAGGISLGLNGATSTMSKIRRAASINGINALLNAGGSDNGKSGLLPPTRSSRKRNSSFLGNIQPRPVTRGKGHRNLMRSLVGSVSDASAFGGAGSSAMPSPRASRSASMRGPLAPSIELNTASLQHVRTLLRQLLGDANIKEVDKWERALMPILLKSTDDLNPDIRSGDIIDIRHYVKVKKIPGGKPGDTTYVSGVVFTKNLALKSMPRNIAHPRIVVVTFPIEYQRHQQQLMSLEPVIAQEKDYLQKMVARITSLRPTLLLVEKNISGVALQLLAQANVATTHLVKPSVIEAVARCAGADICSSVDKLLLHNFRVGRCASFDVKTFVHEDIPEKKKTFMYLSGCPKELGCTIVLRGGDMETLAVLKQITEMMIYVVYNLKLETCLMRDEFVNIPSSSSIAPTPTVVPTAAPQTDAPTAAFDDPEKTLSTEDGQENLAASENQEKSPNSRSEESERMAGGVPDDIPSPTYYEDMVKNHETKVLSASPFVKYMQPYLLMRARELERKLVYLKRLRDSQVVEDDEQTEFGSDGRVGELEEHVENEKSADPDKPVEKFELIQPEMVDANVKNGTKKMIEVLRAIHDAEYDKALHVYETQKKQWENYLSQYDDLFDPYAHQNIAILYSLVCTLTTVPCEGPELRRLGFYIQGMDWPLGKSDCTLGQYVELLCNTANKQCESDTCDKKMIDHHRSYVHGQARVSVLVSDKMACPIQGMQDTILMWSYCKVCPNTNTPAIPMSESTWKYSFGKYLELAFWSSEMKLRAGNCPHDLNRDHVRCFGYRGLTVVFQYDPIDLLEIVVPRTKITYQPEIDLSNVASSKESILTTPTTLASDLRLPSYCHSEYFFAISNQLRPPPVIMSTSREEGSDVPQAAKSSWGPFLKSIASFNGDLASLTAPPFILSVTSLTEYSGYWAEHPEIFVAPAQEKDPQKRALAVLKWFLSTLKQQYSSRNEKLGSEKKPLNPFLGELFLGTWKDPSGVIGDTQLISEQVSHHPPVTAYAIINDKHGVKLEGYNGQKASFTRGTITVKQIGHAKYHLKEFNEDYVITLPSLHIEGIVYGSPYVELNKSSTITSSTGYVAKIEYSGKGWVTGKKNTFTATLSKEGSKDILYTIDGQWTDSFIIKEGKSKKEFDLYNAKASKTTPLYIAPLEKQDSLESRNAWAKVQSAIVNGDLETTSAEKTKIENEQRELRKKEKEEGREWERRYFTRVQEDPVLKALGDKSGVVLEPEKTDGIWVFDNAKYQKVLEKAKSPVAEATD